MFCSIKSCDSNSKTAKKNIQFFRFPCDPDIRNSWLAFCKEKWKNREIKKGTNARVCSLHFTKSDYVRDLQAELSSFDKKRKLKPDAIPSLNIWTEESRPTSTSRHSSTNMINEGKSFTNSEAQQKTQFGMLCRLCTKSDYDCVPIFEEKGQEIGLKIKIINYLQLNVQPDDRLPDKICLFCLDAINVWHEYVLLCRNADKKLRTLFQVEDEVTMHESETRSMSDLYEADGITENQEIKNNTESRDHSNENTLPQELISLPHEDLHEMQRNIYSNETATSREEQTVLKIQNHSESESCWDIANIHEQSSNKENHNPILSVKSNLSSTSLNAVSLHTNKVACQSDNKTITCRLCSMKFCDFNELTNHRALVHGNIYRNIMYVNCPICKQRYENKVFKEHIRTHSGVCDTCYEIFPDDTELAKHKRTHLKFYKCDMCAETFSCKSVLRLHLKVYHEKECIRYKCDPCSVMYKWPSGLFRHNLLVHSNQSTVQCDICGNNFLGYYLKIHIKEVHSAHHSYHCDLCGKHFKTKRYIQKHMECHSQTRKPVKRIGSQNNSFKCEKCNRVFISKSGLSLHNRADCLLGGMCSKCGLFCETSQMYRKHLLKHKQHSFECRVCGKSFVSKHARDVHERTHTGERPFSCNFCDLKFISKRGLIKHGIVHSGSNRFMCKDCGKTFKRKENLAAHLQIHMFDGQRKHGERPLTPSDVKKHTNVQEESFIDSDMSEIVTGNLNTLNEIVTNGLDILNTSLIDTDDSDTLNPLEIVTDNLNPLNSSQIVTDNNTFNTTLEVPYVDNFNVGNLNVDTLDISDTLSNYIATLPTGEMLNLSDMASFNNYNVMLPCIDTLNVDTLNVDMSSNIHDTVTNYYVYHVG